MYAYLYVCVYIYNTYACVYVSIYVYFRNYILFQFKPQHMLMLGIS